MPHADLEDSVHRIVDLQSSKVRFDLQSYKVRHRRLRRAPGASSVAAGILLQNGLEEAHDVVVLTFVVQDLLLDDG